MIESEIKALLAQYRAEHEIIKVWEKNEHDNYWLNWSVYQENNVVPWMDAVESLNLLEGKIEILIKILNHGKENQTEVN
jgi:hypothetical protein